MWLVKTHTELNEHYERRVKNNIVRITEQCYLLFHLCHEVAMTSLSPWTLRKTMKKTKTKNKTDVTYETRVGVFQPISKHRDNGKLTKNMRSG